MELFKDQRGKVKIKLETLQDRIAAYMVGKLDELCPDEYKIMLRWNAVWSFLQNYQSPLQAVNAHHKKHQLLGDEDQISMRTAWSDYRNACRLWSNVVESNYVAKLILLEEYAMKTFQMAAKERDVTGMNAAIKNLIKITEENKSLEELMGDPGSDANKFVLEINVAGKKEPFTIDLDSYQILPEEENEKVLDAIQETEISTLKLREMLGDGK